LRADEFVYYLYIFCREMAEDMVETEGNINEHRLVPGMAFGDPCRQQ
jgi:hypothetical protein